MRHALNTMAKRIRTEIFWIIGLVVLTNLIWYSILGGLLSNGRLLEIQIHDTYLIVPKLFLVGLTFLVLLLFMYLLRWIHARTINRTLTIFTVVLTTVLLILLLFSWLTSLQEVHDLGRSLYMEINGTDRVQVTLLSHATLTLAVGIVTLFDMTMGYKLIVKKK